MNSTMTKTPMKRWMLLWACFMGVGILLAATFIGGLLSLRGFGIAALISGLAYAIAAVLTIRKSPKEFPPLALPGTPIEPATRKLLLRRIRRAKITIALMCIVLVIALIQIKDFPIPALLVGLVVNLATTAQSIRTIIRLKKILRGSPDLLNQAN